MDSGRDSSVHTCEKSFSNSCGPIPSRSFSASSSSFSSTDTSAARTASSSSSSSSDDFVFLRVDRAREDERVERVDRGERVRVRDAERHRKSGL